MTVKEKQLVKKILEDQILLCRLSEKVYQLLIDDLYCQRDKFSRK